MKTINILDIHNYAEDVLNSIKTSEKYLEHLNLINNKNESVNLKIKQTKKRIEQFTEKLNKEYKEVTIMNNEVDYEKAYNMCITFMKEKGVYEEYQKLR